ncbi:MULTISPECIES: M28 family peptidase [Emticicia]|uniref:M28 family peptidase n=1 Tax=Emticicia TaxID=312278 RepID=UPI0007D8A9FF|nr:MULTISPECIES: M28 family peptidase [Emticicia]
MKKIFLTICLCITFSGFAQNIVSEQVLKHLENIDTNKIKAHVAYLSDDKLKGRLPGKEGYQMAVDYAIEQYKSMGLKPAGENGGFTQKVILRKAKLVKEAAKFTLTLPNGEKKELTLGNDLSIYPHPELKSVDFTAPLVFVGSGFDAPQINIEDYKGLNVKGKIVVILRRVPDNLPANVKLHLQYPATLQEFAAKNGAIGVLVCNYTTSMVQFKAAANGMVANGISASVTADGKRTSCASALGGKIMVAGGISVPTLQELMRAENNMLDSTWQQLEKGKFVSKPLKSMISGHYESTHQDITSFNVVAKLEGTDAKLKKEYVIHSAHLDHLGVGKPINGDSIYNGAHDNASGVACALEIARSYATLPASLKPKRSLLFLLVTAEEMGLLGSGYFAAYPTVKKSQIVADINTDMPTLLAPLESVAPLGAEHSSLQKVVDNAASIAKLEVEPDPDPSEGRFVRSDQYNFVKAGIPALHIKYGYRFSNPKLNLAENVKKWRETHYHKPSDEITNGFVWSAGKTYARVNFLVSYLVAQTEARPTWNKGDFFEPRK